VVPYENRIRRHTNGKKHPSRPLFFVAHSVGGLVVKILLLKASKVMQYRPIMYNCHGVAFFGDHKPSSSVSQVL
jgi:hypothetical protein